MQYDRVIYILEDTPEARKLINRYIEVYEYSDGRIELRADGIAFAYQRYDKLSEINQGTVVESCFCRWLDACQSNEIIGVPAALHSELIKALHPVRKSITTLVSFDNLF